MKKKYKGSEYEARKAWNKYHPDDMKIRGDGYDIHHKDENPANNAENNLQKLLHEKHTHLHQKGAKRSPEFCKITSERMKGNKYGLGKQKSKETLAIMRECNLGNKNPMYGTHKTPDEKIIMSKRMSGKNNPMYGKKTRGSKGYKHTEETKLKLAESARGNKRNLGSKRTEEQKQRMAEAQKRRWKMEKQK